MPSRGATDARSARNGGVPGLVGFTNTATRSVFGTASFSSSISLMLTSFTRNDRPVTLPSGRARLVTRPYRTGSPLPSMTMGIVPLAFLVACVAGDWEVNMTLTRAWTKSAASCGRRLLRPSATRCSMVMFRPEIHPTSRKASSKSRSSDGGGDVPPQMKPMRGACGSGCAGATTGVVRRPMTRRAATAPADEVSRKRRRSMPGW